MPAAACGPAASRMLAIMLSVPWPAWRMSCCCQVAIPHCAGKLRSRRPSSDGELCPAASQLSIGDGEVVEDTAHVSGQHLAYRQAAHADGAAVMRILQRRNSRGGAHRWS